MSGKWLELLKEIAPRVTRAAVLRNPAIAAGSGQLGAIQAVAPSFGVELSPVNVRDAGEIERAVAAFARSPNGGLIVTASAAAQLHLDLIITLAARHKLPAVYADRIYVTGGGLISYGPDRIDQYRRAAGYVDRILKGEKPADLPVQAPTKYELVINLKTAKALGLDIAADAARPRRRGDRVRRREFITLLGGAVAWPLAARAQQSGRVRRIGVIMGDFDSAPRIKAFKSAWPALGWVEGRNVHVDYHFAAGNPDSFRSHAAALVAATPEVILVGGTSILAAVRQATQSIPTVFVGISDPEGAGVVANLSRPGGNLTGFANFEPAIGGKWLQTLKEAAPNVTRVVVLRNPDGLKRIMTAIETSAPAFGVEALECSARNAEEIARVLGSVVGQPNTGLIMMPDPILTISGRLIIDWAATNRVPALYPFRSLVTDGGLMCYGVDVADQVRRAAFYIDRILNGEKPADMPVQAPTKFELVINLRTAKALGLTVPPTLLTSADEVIE